MVTVNLMYDVELERSDLVDMASRDYLGVETDLATFSDARSTVVELAYEVDLGEDRLIALAQDRMHDAHVESEAYGDSVEVSFTVELGRDELIEEAVEFLGAREWPDSAEVY